MLVPIQEVQNVGVDLQAHLNDLSQGGRLAEGKGNTPQLP